MGKTGPISNIAFGLGGALLVCVLAYATLLCMRHRRTVNRPEPIPAGKLNTAHSSFTVVSLNLSYKSFDSTPLTPKEAEKISKLRQTFTHCGTPDFMCFQGVHSISDDQIQALLPEGYSLWTSSYFAKHTHRLNTVAWQNERYTKIANIETPHDQRTAAVLLTHLTQG